MAVIFVKFFGKCPLFCFYILIFYNYRQFIIFKWFGNIKKKIKIFKQSVVKHTIYYSQVKHNTSHRISVFQLILWAIEKWNCKINERKKPKLSLILQFHFSIFTTCFQFAIYLIAPIKLRSFYVFCSCRNCNKKLFTILTI